MEPMKLFDSELKSMELVWENENAPAAELARLAANRYGWNKNTTYTVLKKLVEKGALKRTDPHFSCRSLVSRDEVRYQETRSLIDKLFGGSPQKLFSSFLNREHLSKEQLSELRELIDHYEEGGT